MADSFTSNLNLTKPEVGASSSTWGTKLNTDLDVVDSLFSGTSTVAYSMKIGSANTLSVAGLLSVSGTASVSGTVTGTGTFNLLSAVVSVGDANFSLKDTGDSTRIVKFELGGLTTSTTRTLTVPDADITLVGTANTQTLTNKTLTNAIVGTQTASDNSTKAASTAYVEAADVVVAATAAGVPGLIYGLTLSTAGSSATFGIAAGKATDSTVTSRMSLASAYTKTTSAWALGTSNGSLDTGAIANSTWYHVFLIQRVDTSVVDVLISLSATAPTMPTSYTLFRRIGSMQTNGSSQWTKFNQQGDRFDRLAVSDLTISGTSAATLRTLSVPTGAVVLPICSIEVQAVNNGTTIVQVAPAADATLLVNAAHAYEGSALEGSTSGTYFYAPPTNTSGQIYVAVPNYSSGSSLSTSGWIDRRGQD